MTARTLIVPAAGRGSRLGGDRPKLLVPVGGVSMIDRLLRAYGEVVREAVVIVHPDFEDEIGQHLSRSPVPFRLATQPAPTGMLDAILAARTVLDRDVQEPVWITWCDQVGVSPATVVALHRATADDPGASIVMPTVWRDAPYIHFERDGNGRIVRVLHRREGDAMPAHGESDMGLFALTADTYWDLLPAFARTAETGKGTAERNFLPFIPWVAAERKVVTFPATDPMEAVGVNTPDELRAMEAYLARREGAGS